VQVAQTHPDSTEFAAFLQDTWRVKKQLTVTMGLRYDAQSFAQPQGGGTVRVDTNPDVGSPTSTA
jgi:outer membrane receptor protein involved in Fe transport